jgi:hypothetical protein
MLYLKKKKYNNVIVRLYGGLGNQLFQYAAGKTLAIRNNCKLSLDIMWYSKKNKLDTPRIFLLDHFNIKADIVRFHFFYIWILKRLHFFYRIKFCAEPEIPPPNNFLKHSIYLDGYWQNKSYFEFYNNSIFSNFFLELKISREASQMKLLIKSSQSVSIHIRRGDFAANEKTRKFHGLCSLNYYKSAMHFFDSNCTFFIFSDDMAYVKRYFPLPTNFYLVSDYINNEIEELYLMSLCRDNIIANSTFSWWAAWLNKNNKKLVIAPKRWFKNKNMSSDHIIPKHWKLL